MKHPPPLPSSRQEALALGEPFYFDGTLCKRGHLSRRYTSNGACEECTRLKKSGNILPGNDVLKYSLLQEEEYDEEGNRIVSSLSRMFLSEEMIETVNIFYRRKNCE